jgi:hypothetical protein
MLPSYDYCDRCNLDNTVTRQIEVLLHMGFEHQYVTEFMFISVKWRCEVPSCTTQGYICQYIIWSMCIRLWLNLQVEQEACNHRFRIDAIFPPDMILLLLKEFMDFSKDF